jgi:RecA/RadA recombinase
MGWAQKQGVYVVLWDTEKKFDKVRFEKHFGGNAAEVNIVATTTIRKGAGAMFKYVRMIKEMDPDAKILLVHDSVGGSVSKARAEREMDDEKNAQPGSEAVENSDYMRHMIATMDKYPGSIALLLINQMTMKIGPMPGKSRSGGEKISFHSSMIIEMTRVQDLTKIVKGVKVKEGIISRAKIAKNHLSQSETSVQEMRVKVTAKGWDFVSGEAAEADDGEES